MRVLFMLDWCGESDNEFYEVTGQQAEIVSKFDGQFVNSTDCSNDFDEWFGELWDNGERRPMPYGFRKLSTGVDELCGPFDRIVCCGMLP